MILYQNGDTFTAGGLESGRTVTFKAGKPDGPAFSLELTPADLQLDLDSFDERFLVPLRNLCALQNKKDNV